MSSIEWMMFAPSARETADQRLRDALSHYHTTRGRHPNQVRIHPTTIITDPPAGVRIIADRHIHPDQMWVGYEPDLETIT